MPTHTAVLFYENSELFTAAKAGALCTGDVLLFVCLFVRLSVVCLQPETRAATGARAGHPDHGCPRCFLPVKNLTSPVKFMLVTGAYSWRR